MRELDPAATDLDAVEIALRNPATHLLIQDYGAGGQDDRVEARVELFQLVPLNDYERPWVVLTGGVGGLEFGMRAYASIRAAQADFAEARDWIQEEYEYEAEEDEAEEDEDGD